LTGPLGSAVGGFGANDNGGFRICRSMWKVTAASSTEKIAAKLLFDSLTWIAKHPK